MFHVPAKEDYLFLDWSSREATGASKTIHHMEYDGARIWIPGSQVLDEASGTRLHKTVWAAVLEWVCATLHLASYNEIAQVYKEQVLSPSGGSDTRSDTNKARHLQAGGTYWKESEEEAEAAIKTELHHAPTRSFHRIGVASSLVGGVPGVTRRQLRVINSIRRELAEWAAKRCF